MGDSHLFVCLSERYLAKYTAKNSIIGVEKTKYSGNPLKDDVKSSSIKHPNTPKIPKVPITPLIQILLDILLPTLLDRFRNSHIKANNAIM